MNCKRDLATPALQLEFDWNLSPSPEVLDSRPGSLNTVRTGRRSPCERPETASALHEWEPIAEGGTPALRAWITQHDLERDAEELQGRGVREPAPEHVQR